MIAIDRIAQMDNLSLESYIYISLTAREDDLSRLSFPANHRLAGNQPGPNGPLLLTTRYVKLRVAATPDIILPLARRVFYPAAAG